MNREEALEQLYHLRLDWEEHGLYCKLNQTDINAIGIIVSELDKANNNLAEINKIVSSYGIQTIPGGLGECPVEVPAHELNTIYKLSIIRGE